MNRRSALFLSRANKRRSKTTSSKKEVLLVNTEELSKLNLSNYQDGTIIYNKDDKTYNICQDKMIDDEIIHIKKLGYENKSLTLSNKRLSSNNVVYLYLSESRKSAGKNYTIKLPSPVNEKTEIELILLQKPKNMSYHLEILPLNDYLKDSKIKYDFTTEGSSIRLIYYKKWILVGSNQMKKLDEKKVKEIPQKINLEAKKIEPKEESNSDSDVSIIE